MLSEDLVPTEEIEIDIIEIIVTDVQGVGIVDKALAQAVKTIAILEIIRTIAVVVRAKAITKTVVVVDIKRAKIRRERVPRTPTIMNLRIQIDRETEGAENPGRSNLKPTKVESAIPNNKAQRWTLFELKAVIR